MVGYVKQFGGNEKRVVIDPTPYMSAYQTPVAGSDYIVWSITVTNLGNVDLFNIHVTDEMPGITFCPGSMSYQVGNTMLLVLKLLLRLPPFRCDIYKLLCGSDETN